MPFCVVFRLPQAAEKGVFREAMPELQILPLAVCLLRQTSL
jgi:hypothetical protein